MLPGTRPPAVGDPALIDERTLLLRAQDGDREAFDALVTRFGRVVLAVARSVLGRRADAEDVAQEVFLRLFRALDRIDPERPLEAWLVRVTLNAARNVRARTPARRETDLAGAGDLRGAEGAGFDRVAAGDVRRVLLEALEHVTEREREVFLLRDVHGLEVRVIAEALGIAGVTVRRLSVSARRKLRGFIAREHPELLREGGRFAGLRSR